MPNLVNSIVLGIFMATSLVNCAPAQTEDPDLWEFVPLMAGEVNSVIPAQTEGPILWEFIPQMAGGFNSGTPAQKTDPMAGEVYSLNPPQTEDPTLWEFIPQMMAGGLNSETPAQKEDPDSWKPAPQMAEELDSVTPAQTEDPDSWKPAPQMAEGFDSTTSAQTETPILDETTPRVEHDSPENLEKEPEKSDGVALEPNPEQSYRMSPAQPGGKSSDNSSKMNGKYYVPACQRAGYTGEAVEICVSNLREMIYLIKNFPISSEVDVEYGSRWLPKKATIDCAASRKRSTMEEFLKNILDCLQLADDTENFDDIA